MSRLLEKIKRINEEAARVLERAEFHTDRDIQSLTREDMNELFPGPDKLKLRKRIHELIPRPQRSADELIRELKGFIPQESLRGSECPFRIITDSEVEEAIKAYAEQSQGGHTAAAPPAAAGQMKLGRNGQRWEVIYNVVVSGQTFTADSQLMEKVKAHLPRDVDLTPSTVDHSVTVLFCPITSRIDSDISAAMPDVKDDKPVILVLMHHVREAKNRTSVRTWAAREQIVMHVNVYYHETVSGLLQCHQNDDAAHKIAMKLLEFSVGPRLPALCETDQHDDAGSGRSGGSRQWF